jgi:O-Antigen ligase
MMQETTLKILGSTAFAERFLELSVLVLLIACLLSPSIQLGSDLKLPLDVLLLPIILYVYFLLVCMRSAPPFSVRLFHIFGALFSFSVLLSMFYGSTHFHYPRLARDYYDVVRVWLPVLFFTIAYQADLRDSGLRRLLTILSFATLLICLYGVAQFLDLPLVDKINPYYSGGEHHDMGLRSDRRVYSTLGNPNVLGQFLSCVFMCYTLKFLSKVGSRLRSAIIVLAVVSTLVLTGSRYALIVSSLGLILVLGMTLGGARRAIRFVSASVLLGLLAWSFTVTKTTDKEAASRFEELAHPTEVNSLRDRLDFLWIDAFEYFERSPILGHGPAKTVFTGVWTDSEYLDILKSYGINGFIFYFSMYLWIVIQLRRGLSIGRPSCRHTDDVICPSTDLFFVRFGFGLILAALIMNVGMTTYFNWQFNTFFWLIMGVAVRSAHTVELFYYSSHFHDISKAAIPQDLSASVRWT